MTPHQEEQLLYRVKKMRQAQKTYYCAPSKHNLIIAKQWESDVDKWVKEIEESKQPQQKLL